MIVTDIEALRRPCEPVLPEEVDELRQKLEAELRRSELLGRPGIGLACPQIGIQKAMAIIRVPGQPNIELVNCKIEAQYDQFVFPEEGCLSFPGENYRTLRYKEVVIADNLVEPHRFVATGLLAVCIQHELDHLRGVLLPDLNLDKNKKPAKPKVKKEKRKKKKR